MNGLKADELEELTQLNASLDQAKATVAMLSKKRHRLIMRGKTRHIRGLAANHGE